MAGLGLLLSCAQCVTSPVPSPISHPDRLKQAYHELASNRFLVVADFEEPSHLELFELVNASGRGKLLPEPSRGRAETGGRAMRFTAGPGDVVVAASRANAEVYLKRDWRPYDLLLASVRSPTAGLEAEITVTAGDGAERRSVSTHAALVEGWGIIRLDLAELGEQVPIDDVTELRIGIQGQSKPVNVVIDDILLTASREDLMGDPADAAGRLYVQRVGRRWNIGAGGRFELTVMNGQIRRLYNLQTDPGRVRNLVEGVSLGPAPVAVGPDGRPAPVTLSPSSLGVRPAEAKVAVQQRIVETTPTRVVLEMTWEFAAEGKPDSPEFFHWRYVVYPTGQIFARVEVSTRERGRSLPLSAGIGLAMLPGTQIEAKDVRLQTNHGGTCQLGQAVNEAARSVLGVIPAECAGRVSVSQDPPKRQATIVLPGGDGSDSAAREWVAQIIVASGPSPEDAAVRLNDRAVDYLSPAPIDLAVGTVAQSSDQRSDGFDVGDGVFVVRPDDHRVRMTLDGTQRPIFSPAFLVADSAGLDAWVYMDHLALSGAGRDADGNVVFKLPDVAKKTLVEVLLRPRSTTSSP